MPVECFVDTNILLYACSSAVADASKQRIAAAVELGCRTLYTEDLNPGQQYEGVRVINPFVGGT